MLPTDKRFDQSYRTLTRSLMERATGFAQCSAALRDELIAEGRLSRFAAGEMLLQHGRCSDYFVMAIEGALEARLVLEGGRRHLLGFVLPGEFHGFLSIIDGGPQPHDIVAHLPSIVLRIPTAEMQRLRLVSQELHVAFEMQMAARSRRVYDKLARSLLYPLRERLAHELSQLADTVGSERGGRWTITLRLSQADLADLLGASRQSVNAELRSLQAAGLVSIAREHIEIPDLNKLRTVGAK